MQYGFGIDLGGTTVKMALFDREGEPRTSGKFPRTPGMAAAAS